MADEHQHHPPGLPPVHDEAADTPLWVPVLGVALLVLLTLAVVLRSELGSGSEDAPSSGATPTEQAGAPTGAANENATE